MKRKTVSIAIATFIALALTACTGKAADVQTEEQVVATEVSETVETVAETTTETEVEAEAEADKETEAVEETYVDSEETTADVQIEESAEGEASDEKNGEEEASDEKEGPAVDEASESVDAANEEDTSKTEETMEEETKPAVTIPDWFDATYYAANNPDVVKALGSSVEALYNHYTAHGKAEGRAAYEGDPNAIERVADNQGTSQEGQGGSTSGESTNTDECPWPLYQMIGEGRSAYFYTYRYIYGQTSADEEAKLDELQDQLISIGGIPVVLDVSDDGLTTHYMIAGPDWTVVGTWNGREITKWYYRD